MKRTHPAPDVRRAWRSRWHRSRGWFSGCSAKKEYKLQTQVWSFVPNKDSLLVEYYSELGEWCETGKANQKGKKPRMFIEWFFFSALDRNKCWITHFFWLEAKMFNRKEIFFKNWKLSDNISADTHYFTSSIYSFYCLTLILSGGGCEDYHVDRRRRRGRRVWADSGGEITKSQPVPAHSDLTPELQTPESNHVSHLSTSRSHKHVTHTTSNTEAVACTFSTFSSCQITHHKLGRHPWFHLPHSHPHCLPPLYWMWISMSQFLS